MADDDRLKCMGIGIRMGDAIGRLRILVADERERVADYDVPVDRGTQKDFYVLLDSIKSEKKAVEESCRVNLPLIGEALGAVEEAVGRLPTDEPGNEPREGESPEELMDALHERIVDLDTRIDGAFPKPGG